MKKYVLPVAALVAMFAACGQASNTAQTATTTTTTEAATPPPATAKVEVPTEINELLNQYTCLSCHAAAEKIVGPAYTEVAKLNYTDEQIVELIAKPKPEHWPEYTAMTPITNVPKADALKIAAWINSLN